MSLQRGLPIKWIPIRVIAISILLAAAAVFVPNGNTAKAAVGGPACNVPTDYATIQAAVSVPACTTVNVAAGVYNENVVITHSLTLNGVQSGVDARTRVGGESIINGGTAANITITADNVTVDGFTLNGPVSSGTAALVMQTGNTGETIQNNVIKNSGRAASITTSNTTFSKNVVNNVFATATDGFQANSTPISNLKISNNNFSGANPEPYNADITVIEGSSNVTVSGNKSTGDGTLIALFKTNGAQITNNTVTGVSNASAIYIGGGDSNVNVSGNTVSSAGSAVNVSNGFGVGLNSSVSISGNTLNNNITGVKVGATAVASAGAVVASRNSLTGNSEFGVNNLSSFNATASCNWWGAANGPGPVGPGAGANVSSNVTYSPWLVSSNLNGPCIGGNIATNKNQCKNGGWQTRTDSDNKPFKNQGQCIKFVEHHSNEVKGDVEYNAYGLNRTAEFEMNTADNKGTFQYSDANDAWYNVKVTSVKVSGNDAWFAGVVTSASDQSWVGQWLFAKVKNNHPDQIWGSFTDQTAAQNDVNNMTAPADGPFNVTDGNLRIN